MIEYQPMFGSNWQEMQKVVIGEKGKEFFKINKGIEGIIQGFSDMSRRSIPKSQIVIAMYDLNQNVFRRGSRLRECLEAYASANPGSVRLFANKDSQATFEEETSISTLFYEPAEKEIDLNKDGPVDSSKNLFIRNGALYERASFPLKQEEFIIAQRNKSYHFFKHCPPSEDDDQGYTRQWRNHESYHRETKLIEGWMETFEEMWERASQKVV